MILAGPIALFSHSLVHNDQFKKQFRLMMSCNNGETETNLAPQICQNSGDNKMSLASVTYYWRICTSNCDKTIGLFMHQSVFPQKDPILRFTVQELLM